MDRPKYLYNFKKRTILYIVIGFTCVFIDYLVFIQFSKFLKPYYSNLFGYFFGSVISFLLNKKFTFKSKNSKLSLIRYFLIIGIGFSISQTVIFIGIYFFNFENYLSKLKIVAIMAAVSLQYICNTFFGSTKKIHALKK